MNDIFYMKKAIKISKKGEFTTSPNPNVGCILVKKDHIIGEGYHEKTGKNHAEINALKMAGQKAKGSTAYVTLEPCNHFGKTPPCCEALIKAGINKIVISNIDPNPNVSGKGIAYLKEKGIIVKTGLLAQESKKNNNGFFKRMNTGLPWTQLKLAISLDGRIALKNGHSKWITSKYARQDVQEFRAKSSVILSTSASVIADNSKLNIRFKELNKNIIKTFPYKNFQHPIRVIIDSKNLLNLSHKIIHTKGPIWLMRIRPDKQKWPKNVIQCIMPTYKKKINILSVFRLLGQKKINNVWIEAGSTFSSFLLNNKYIDEVILYMAPKILGNQAMPLCILDNKLKLSECLLFRFYNIHPIGSDIRMILRPNDIKLNH